jgi:hypothetical protein
MTSEELTRDLRDIEWLLNALTARHDVADEDLEDLRWLLARRRFLSGLQAIRRAQKGKKIVDLELWRSGHVLGADVARVA